MKGRGHATAAVLVLAGLALACRGATPAPPPDAFRVVELAEIRFDTAQRIHVLAQRDRDLSGVRRLLGRIERERGDTLRLTLEEATDGTGRGIGLPAYAQADIIVTAAMSVTRSRARLPVGEPPPAYRRYGPRPETVRRWGIGAAALLLAIAVFVLYVSGESRS